MKLNLDWLLQEEDKEYTNSLINSAHDQLLTIFRDLDKEGSEAYRFILENSHIGRANSVMIRIKELLDVCNRSVISPDYMRFSSLSYLSRSLEMLAVILNDCNVSMYLIHENGTVSIKLYRRITTEVTLFN